MEKKELLSRVKNDGVKFISLQFSDVTGSVKSVDITPERLETAQKPASPVRQTDRRCDRTGCPWLAPHVRRQ